MVSEGRLEFMALWYKRYLVMMGTRPSCPGPDPWASSPAAQLESEGAVLCVGEETLSIYGPPEGDLRECI